MSDQTSDPDGDILRGLGETHEDQPGDLGSTRTEKTEKPTGSVPDAGT